MLSVDRMRPDHYSEVIVSRRMHCQWIKTNLQSPQRKRKKDANSLPFCCLKLPSARNWRKQERNIRNDDRYCRQLKEQLHIDAFAVLCFVPCVRDRPTLEDCCQLECYTIGYDERCQPVADVS